MKRYPENLFSIWETDIGEMSRPSGEGLNGDLFPSFAKRIRHDLDWIDRTVKTINHIDTSNYDSLYRKSSVLSGLSGILKLDNLHHLLLLLEAVCDFARQLRSYESHSLNYLVTLLKRSILEAIESLESQSFCVIRTAEVIEECRNCLERPMKSFIAERERKREADLESFVHSTTEISDPLPTPSKPVAAPEAPPTRPIMLEGVDDGPEPVNIPIGKIGILSDFCEESRENLTLIGQRLVEMETVSDPTTVVNDIFRGVHTLKAGARMMQVGKLEKLAHELETVLDDIRRNKKPVSSELVDLLFAASDALERMVGEVAAKGPIRTKITPILLSLQKLTLGAPQSEEEPAISDKVTLTVAPTVTEEDEEEVLIPSQPVSPSTDAALIESIRVSIDKLDDVLNSSSEIFINRIRIQSEVDGLHRSVEQLKHVIENLSELEQQALNERGSRATRQMRTELLEIMTRTSVKLPAILHDEISNCFRRSLDGVINNIDFPGFEELALTTLSVEEIKLVLQSSLKELEQLSSRLLKGAMSFRMVPLSSLFGRYPAEVRQMARQTNKNVQLEISGEDTEIDKMLINQLADPLMHLLRNSVDHGIEATEIRRQKGKPDIGRIQLRAYYEGSHVVVEIQDDGKGFETAKVLQRAISAGLVDVGSADELSETEILDFIFEPGFSTAEQISKLSGRGVGMDVVRSALTQIQGTIQVTNHVDGGAIVTMKLPLTLAVVRILLLEENFHQFGFPILQVNEVVAVKKEEILHVGQRLAWNYRGQTLPVTTLSSILNFQPSRFIEQELPLLILHEGERQIGVLADKVLGMQDVLIKNFGTYIKKVPFMMGCTILSDSRLVSILNPIDVVNFGDAATVKSFSEAVSEAHKARVDHTVLVIDDSKIQRTKLSSVLVRAGYSVTTVKNGYEALKMVRLRKFSAFCVDIIMPLMDGFEFVERLRNIPGCESVPVLFMSGKLTDRDRDHAKSYGAIRCFEKPVDPKALVLTLDKECLPKSLIG